MGCVCFYFCSYKTKCTLLRIVMNKINSAKEEEKKVAINVQMTYFGNNDR